MGKNILGGSGSFSGGVQSSHGLWRAPRGAIHGDHADGARQFADAQQPDEDGVHRQIHRLGQPRLNTAFPAENSGFSMCFHLYLGDFMGHAWLCRELG